LKGWLDMGAVYLKGSAHLFHLTSFRISCGCVLLQEKISQYIWGERVICAGNNEIISIGEIYKYCQLFILNLMTKSLTVTAGPIVTERYVSLPFIEINNYHCDTSSSN
jgi:hypothetical protein